MPISADHFTIKSIRPAEHVEPKEVPQELREKLEGKVVSLENLEQDLGVPVKTQRLYHGGDSLVVVYWNGEEYVLDLDPAPGE